mmetsp:Transcript_37383/g.91600  ORF Transcript_37383/g.91600 Transcript_37383/m.91600 type:complete len:208 (+) Transcript_37383:164-787(+)
MASVAALPLTRVKLSCTRSAAWRQNVSASSFSCCAVSLRSASERDARDTTAAMANKSMAASATRFMRICSWMMPFLCLATVADNTLLNIAWPLEMRAAAALSSGCAPLMLTPPGAPMPSLANVLPSAIDASWPAPASGFLVSACSFLPVACAPVSATNSRRISLVPSKMRKMRRSRTTRSTPASRMKPMPPSTCSASSATCHAASDA